MPTRYSTPVENHTLVDEFELRWRSPRKSEDYINLNKFELVKTLGAGSFGRVLLVILEPMKSEYALKVLDKVKIVKNKQIEQLRSEIRILFAISHPLCVALYSLFKDNSYIYLLMEYLTDFGFAKRIQTRTYTLCGTPDYFCPEIIKSKGHGKGVDWWTLGILIYEMCSGNPPFKGQNEVALYESVCRKKPVILSSFSSTLKDIILQLLQKDPTQRLGCLARGTLDVKEHGWFSKVDFVSIYTQQMSSPFKKNVIVKSISEHRRRARSTKEKPLVISHKDTYADDFKDF
ncbi:unnamed protein product [Didymodactylos carnosus]|nr:unnamed protein product [Didymodactylos carnosus]CAF3655023.1 unnamed protein product [Didymodactylos carnosus]